MAFQLATSDQCWRQERMLARLGADEARVPIRHDRSRYRERWRIEATISRLKDFRRVATRYNKLARTFLDAVTLAAIYAFWL